VWHRGQWPARPFCLPLKEPRRDQPGRDDPESPPSVRPDRPRAARDGRIRPVDRAGRVRRRAPCRARGSAHRRPRPLALGHAESRAPAGQLPRRRGRLRPRGWHVPVGRLRDGAAGLRRRRDRHALLLRHDRHAGPGRPGHPREPAVPGLLGPGARRGTGSLGWSGRGHAGQWRRRRRAGGRVPVRRVRLRGRGPAVHRGPGDRLGHVWLGHRPLGGDQDSWFGAGRSHPAGRRRAEFLAGRPGTATASATSRSSRCRRPRACASTS
jgi:hypothetical protein